MRTDNGYLRRSLVEVVYPGARYATLPAVAPWLWALRPCCLSSCAAQGSSRLSGANGGPTRSGPAVVGDSMADDVRQKLSGQRSSIPTNSCNSEAQLLALAETAVAHWHSWWRVPESASRLSLETRLDRNFRVCFPLSANAINHIEASLTARSRCPWRISDSFVRPWEAHTGSRWGFSARDELTRAISPGKGEGAAGGTLPLLLDELITSEDARAALVVMDESALAQFESRSRAPS